MKRYLIKCFLLILPVFFYFAMAEYQLAKIPTSYSKRKLFLEQQLNEIQGLIFGSSHAVYNYVPDEFTLKTFNLSNISQSLTIDEKLLNLYVNQIPNLCFVIFNLSYFSFEYMLTGNIDDPRNGLYFRHYGFQGDARFWEQFDLSYWLLYIIFDPERAPRIMFDPKKDFGKEITKLGGFDISNSTREWTKINPASGRSRALYHTESMKERHIERNLITIKKMISRLKSKGVQTFFVQSPAYKTYTNYLNSEKQTRFYNLIDSLEIELWDYLKDDRFTKTDFINNDHLNNEGARKFTKILIEEKLNNRNLCSK